MRMKNLPNRQGFDNDFFRNPGEPLAMKQLVGADRTCEIITYWK